MTRTMMAAVASFLLCGPALGDDAGTDQIRATLLGTPEWVYEMGQSKDHPDPHGARGKLDPSKVSFVEKDGKLIGVMDESWRKCSNEVTLRADGFEWQNCRGYDLRYVRSGNEFKNTSAGWHHTIRPAP